ncbi:MAG TPA: bifunctional DNA-formamidopyrimidine glycosylase/DNA-(apurinic or apyrimidinic site) lyase [Dehalococcoidia bacterium]|nr:bifunctional DNA-formamidopyrimidine glycosylase/DNA-(apurinic or apyrimidinic site) lyase [Dehalococcoidia bacterium]
MPELPEVETVRNELLPFVAGQRITGVTLAWEGIVKEPPVEEFCSRIIGQKITAITRRGKYLFFHLGNQDFLVIHLKMTGSLIVSQKPPEPLKFIRAIIHLDNATSIYFRDPRKFGVMRLVKDTETIRAKLGPEPLEEGFTTKLLAERLAKRTAPIKAVLLDQKAVAGIGNMYADEALHAAGINPWRPGGSLTPSEIKRLHRELRRILWAAIENKGASVDTYFRPDGSEGSAHYQFKVAHGLGGKTCTTCGGPIERVVVRNRGTYYCSRCQPLK